MFDEFVKEITSELEAKESRGRARSGDAQGNFEYAVRFILEGLWKNLCRSLQVKPLSIFVLVIIRNCQDTKIKSSLIDR